MSEQKRKFHVGACITISVNCEVTASSVEEAKKLALDMPLVSINEGGNEGDAAYWHTSGELDGEPFDLEVEER
jgi:hypothetical protein